MEKQKTTKIDPQATDSKREKVRVIPINCFVDFPGHPFKVQMDDEMIALIESVKNFGIINPLLARKTNDEKYEIVAGRRRKFAALKVGLETLPVIVRDMTRDEAIIMMVDSNLQREKILPSERAFAYKMKLEALKRQGKRNDLTSTPVVSKLRANETVGSESGDSREQVRRYIRLTFLIKDLMLRSDEEQFNIISAFASWLKIAPMRLQFKSITRKADSDKHVAMVREELAADQNQSCQELGEEYIKLIKDVGNKEALTRRFFLIFQ